MVVTVLTSLLIYQNENINVWSYKVEVITYLVDLYSRYTFISVQWVQKKVRLSLGQEVYGYLSFPPVITFTIMFTIAIHDDMVNSVKNG